MTGKKELSKAELLEKHRRLLDELNSDEHRERTETTSYGSHNPFDVPEVNCDRCNIAPLFGRVGPHNNRWNISCPSCNKTIQHPQTDSWKALLHWWHRNLGSHHYRELPLFGLGTLDAPAARRRMAGIRRDLEIKKGLADAELLLSRVIEIPPPGTEYHWRLDAYLGWAMLALALLKREDGGTQRLKRLEFLASVEQKPSVP